VRDLRVVELVENVLVEVLGIEPDEVVPYALIRDDLGAGPAQVLMVLSRLGQPVPPPRVVDDLPGGAAYPRTVEELVDRVEADVRGGSQALGAVAAVSA